MPVRASMSDLIVRTRSLYGDPAGPNAKFDDQTIQDALDSERLDVNISDWRELLPYYSVVAGAWQWTEFYDPSNYGDWEADAVLYNAGLTLLTPTTSDYLTGHWSFGAVNQAPPVFVVGKTYDVYAAARKVVLRWIGLEATSFDFSAMRGTSFTVSQKREGLQMLADYLATEMRVRTARLVRRDAYGAFSY